MKRDEMKTVTITIADNEVKVNIDGVDNYTDLLVALATFEGIVGGIMEADKPELRIAVDEIQNDLQTKVSKT